MALDDAFLLYLDRRSAEQTARVRALLVASGSPALVAEFDQRMRDVRLGVDSARNCWHSISKAQRRILVLLGGGYRLRRRSGRRGRYDACRGAERIEDVCSIRTVRNLSARDLCHVDGGLPDPEAEFVITERGRFVLRQRDR